MLILIVLETGTTEHGCFICLNSKCFDFKLLIYILIFKSSQELLPGIHETFLEPATGRGKARQQPQRKKLCAVCCVWSGVVSATDVAWAK